MLIPKNIYMSWPTKNIINSSSILIEHGLKKLIKLNPKWNVTISNDEEINEYLKRELDINDYKLIKDDHIVAKTDVWRLVKLYNEGGVYIDMDRYCNVSLDDVIEDTAMCVLPICKDVDFSQDIMISSPNNPIFMSAYILNMQRRKEGITNTYLLGPQTYMHAITLQLCGEMINTNPGSDKFNSIIEKINEVNFIQTYIETSPLNTFIYRHDGNKSLEDWETNKRNLYAEQGLKHWTGEW